MPATRVARLPGLLPGRVFVAALGLTLIGEAGALWLADLRLARLALGWWAVAFVVLAAYRLSWALLALVSAVPLVSVELSLGDLGATISTDKVALGVIAAAWVARRGLDLGWTRLVPSATAGWIALLVVVGASALVHGPTLADARGLAEQVTYAAVFAMTLDLAEREPGLARRVLVAAVMTGGVVASLGLVDWILRDFGLEVPFYFRRGTQMDAVVRGSTIGHVNYLAGYLVLLVPPAAGLAVARWGPRGWLALAAAAMTLALVYADSMGAWAGLAVALLVVVGLTARRLRGAPRWAMAAAAGLAVIVAASTVLPELVRQSASVRTRVVTYRVGLAALAERPLVGFGAESYPVQYLRLERQLFGRELLDLRDPRGSMSAHSAYLDLAVQYGLPALGAFAVILAGVFHQGLRGWSRGADRTSPVVAGLVAGLGAFSVAALFENLFWFSKIAAVFWVLAATLVHLAREAARAGSPGTGP